MNKIQGYPSGERISVLQILMLFLSICALGAIFVQSAFDLPSNVDALLDLLDFFVCAIFFFDFCIRFYKAPSKKSFLKWGWIDLISCIPKFEIFRFRRMLRVIRILRMFRAFRSTKVLVQMLFAHRGKSAAVSVIAIAVVFSIFASIAILNIETVPEANIKTPSDALWWAATTVTTVGYGDRFPVTIEGRIVAFFLMVVGVGLFGTLTGFIASSFVEHDKKENRELSELIIEVRALRKMMESSGNQNSQPDLVENGQKNE